MKHFIIIFVAISTLIYAEDYSIGHGLQINQNLNIGGYFSTQYEKSDILEQYMFDDIALLAYGGLSDKLSYLIEMEAKHFAVRDIKNSNTSYNTKFHIERAYLDYKYSEHLSFKVGKFITPIGEWNLNQINVLRDTTSSPLYGEEIFPKFTTGMMLYGHLWFDDTLKYSLFLQKSKDFDKNYNNIETDNYYGMQIKKHFDDIVVGLNIGQFEYEKIDEMTLYYGASFKYEKDDIQILSEYSMSKYEYGFGTDKGKVHDKYAYYIQGRYRLNRGHYLIGRYEGLEDKNIARKENISIIGYNYRPIYPISIKGEYQFNSDDTKSKFMLSVSMLF